MEILKDIVYWAFLIYMMQMVLAGIWNIIFKVRIPYTVVEFFKLTFLPYVVFNYKKYSR